MKNKFKSLSISLMIVFLLTTLSCQVEETIVETENIKNQNDLLIKKISFNEINNSAVVDKINKTKTLTKRTASASNKIIKDTLNNFYINSDEGIYIEKTNGTKSYTFSVFRENSTDLENLVIIVYPNNEVKTFLVDYNKTFNELNSMSLEQMQNNQIEYYEINFNTNEFIPVFQNNLNGRYICETIMFWDTIPCYEGDLVGDGQGIDCWGWVIIGHTCWEGGSGGGEGFGFDSDFGTNGNGSPTGGGGSTGSGSSGSSSNQIITTPTTSLESEQEAQALIKRQKNFISNLTWTQSAWLNNNSETKNSIYEYLESQVTDPLANEYSVESVQFVEELIEGLVTNPQPIYTSADYPGDSDGMPFEWWKDNIYMTSNFEVLEEDPNPAELLAFSLFPDKALLHIQNSTTALNKTQQLVINNTLTGIEDGRADAFRHAYWNALGTAEFGSNITQIFTDAHEAYSSGLPKQMDLHNNQKGREKAITMSFNFLTSDSDIADSILIEVYVGHLLFIHNGVLTPTD